MYDAGDEGALLEARHVTKIFPAAGNRKLYANNDVNLTMYKGRTLGIAGESGCGKSTLAKMLVQLDKPTKGAILFKGQDLTTMRGERLRLQRRHIQMVFQDPIAAFNPKMKIKHIVCEPLLNYGLITRGEVEREAVRLLEMVDLPGEFAERYPHNTSGGQRQRVDVARALALEPEVLICDEATSALDVLVQRNIIELLVRLQKQEHIAIAFICHDISLARSVSHQMAIMYLGNIVELIPGEQVGKTEVHPYTQALIDSIFSIDMDFSNPLGSIDSEAPSPLDALKGCPFQNRCGQYIGICRNEKPVLKEVAADHKIACHLF
jgi:oligopeptide/dipeptide ABC transporter ATP-binding protein